MSSDYLRQGIQEAAEALGIDPQVLATVISYETAGTFDPRMAGPTTQWGQHRGLIQWGEPQAQQYGVDFSSAQAALESQLGANGAIVQYMLNAGVRPGHGLLDVYSAVNAGRVGRYEASDANNGGAPGTVRDKVENQMDGHMANAREMFSGVIESGNPAESSGAPATPAVQDDYDFFSRAVGGAAAREDSFSGLDERFRTRLGAMMRAAEEEGIDLTITSAYRSPELQAQLYESALQRYGSEAEARRWVAPPGRSMHNHGMAVDFAAANGGLLRDPNSAEAIWLRENAERFGLAVPMDWEPWQIELAGGRSGEIAEWAGDSAGDSAGGSIIEGGSGGAASGGSFPSNNTELGSRALMLEQMNQGTLLQTRQQRAPAPRTEGLIERTPAYVNVESAQTQQSSQLAQSVPIIEVYFPNS